MKKISTLIALMVAIGVFLLDYVPIQIALAMYAVVGIVIGAFWHKAKNWAVQGIIGLVVGLGIGYFLDEILPEMLRNIHTDNRAESMFFLYMPFIIKALIIWLAVVKLMKKFRKTASAF